MFSNLDKVYYFLNTKFSSTPRLLDSHLKTSEPQNLFPMIPHNPIGWIEIPVTDMDRAIRFYETVFGFKLERHQMGPLDMAWFPSKEGSTGSAGTLVRHPEFYSPSDKKGPLVYFTAFSGDVATELGRVEAAGGKVLTEKKQISPDHGYMGLFLDSEGNRIALHSRG